MGSKPKKIVKKIIPKEIKPALPALAAIGLPYLAASGTFGSALATFAKTSPGFAAALSNAAAQAATQDKFDIKSAALSGLQAGVGAKLQGAKGFEFLKDSPKTAAFLEKTGTFLNPASAPNVGVAPAPYGIGPEGISFDKALETASAIGKATLPVASVDTARYAVEMNEKALRDYEAQLRSQGIIDSAERRNQIFGYFSRAGYADDEINSMLDKYGYAYGGRVGYKEGGEIQALIDYLKEKEDEEDEFNLSKFSTGLEGIKSGYEIATGQPLMGLKPQPTRFGLAEGGLMSLRAGGMPAEMDMRGGGFIPIGQRERADDVPARLSKNEFVMTADAVRAAGDGNINKGAKRMYDLMNKLEARR